MHHIIKILIHIKCFDSTVTVNGYCLLLYQIDNATMIL